MIVVEFAGIYIGLYCFHGFRHVFYRLRHFHQRDTLFRQAAGELHRAPRVKPEFTYFLAITPRHDVRLDNVMIDDLTVRQFKMPGSRPFTVQFRNMVRCCLYPVFRKPEFALNMHLSARIFINLNCCGHVDFICQVNTDPDRVIFQFIIRRVFRTVVPFS